MSKTLEPHILKQYTLVKQVGSGAYGIVWEVVDKFTNQRFALKKIFDAFRNDVDAQRTFRQVDILFKLKHPNIIKLIRVHRAFNNRDLYLVFQYMEADLYSLIGSNILKKMHMIYVFYQILKAINYIHSASLIHRDLKPSNILIDSLCNIKLCDFGLVRSLQLSNKQQDKIMSEEVATKWYRAPQLLLGSNDYHRPIDIWSFGCIAVQIIYGKPIFTGDSTIAQFEEIMQFTGSITKQDIQSLNSPIIQELVNQIKPMRCIKGDILKRIDPDFHQLINGCLQLNPNKRLTADKLLGLKIFSQFQNDQKLISVSSIKPALNDDIRYSVKIYRDKIYQTFSKKENILSLGKKNTINYPHFRKNRSLAKSLQSGKRKLSHSLQKAGSMSTLKNYSTYTKTIEQSPYLKSLKNILSKTSINPYGKYKKEILGQSSHGKTLKKNKEKSQLEKNLVKSSKYSSYYKFMQIK